MKDKKENISKNVHNSLTKTATNEISIPNIINEIDNYYKQGTLAYAEGVSRYKVEITKLLNHIEKLIAAKSKEENALKELEQELAINTRLLERIQDDFIQKVNSIEELNTEYKNVVKVSDYKKLLKRKTKELYKVQDEIEELELTYLNCELERINHLEVLEPKRREIEILKESKKELELEKEHFTSTKLHQLPLMASANTAVNLDDDEMVDTDIV
jgi:chromosome segregation ATPase